MKKAVAILLSALCLLAAGCSSQEETVEVIVPNTPDAVVTPAPATPTPAPTPTPYVGPHAEKQSAAYAENSDTVGWISIQGTNIDYPIMFGGAELDKLFFYAEHDFNKEENEIGAVYSHFDMANYEAHNVAQNLVMTAHNNRVSYYNGKIENAMFHELHHIQAVNLGKEYCGYDENDRECKVKLDPAVLPNLSTPEGRTWNISICGIDAQWEVWAMYEVDEDEPNSTLYYNVWFPLGEDNKQNPEDEADIQEWINKQLERSEMNFGVNVTTSDQFLTIYTCGDNHDSDDANSRLYFFLKQVNPVSAKFQNGVMVTPAPVEEVSGGEGAEATPEA